MVVIVTGVSGAGKTTIGYRLAEALGARFFEADDFQPAANLAKESGAQPLDDADREPWLTALEAAVDEWVATGLDAVLAFTGLRQAWRDRLTRGRPAVRVVYLRGAETTVRARHAARRGHFFPTALLGSQFARLEEPRDAITVEIDAAPETIVKTLCSKLALAAGALPGRPGSGR